MPQNVKKILTAVLILAMMIFTGCGGEDVSAENDANKISNDAKKIVIGVDDEFPPIGFHDEKKNFVGFDVDLAKEAARRMNVEIEFKPIDWDKKKEAIISGSVDMIWNGLDITEERKDYMIFTKPYMEDRQILLVKADDDFDIHVEEDLEGRIVGIQAGSTAEDYLNGNDALKNLLKECKAYEKFNGLVEALKAGQIEVIICDEMIARYEMNQNPETLRLLNVKVGDVAEMAVGFPKDKVELRDKVQEVFDTMISDGTAKKISERWFRADVIKQSWNS